MLLRRHVIMHVIMSFSVVVNLLFEYPETYTNVFTFKFSTIFNSKSHLKHAD